MVVCLFPTSRVRGSRITVQGSRCCGSALVRVCASFEKCVPGIFSFLAHNISLYINDLTKCVPCVPCVPAFLSSFTHLIDIPILFSKSNFDLKLVAHMAHISESRMVAHFLLFQFWHTLWHTPGTHTPVSGTHSKITLTMSTNRGPRATNHDPSLSMRVTRSSVGFSCELVNSD